MSNIEVWTTKFPRKLWFGTMEFEVRFVPVGHAALKQTIEGVEEELEGCAEFDPPVVHFCESLSLPKLLEIVHHELTHIVNYIGDIEDGAEEETLCRKHGEIWSQFWVNNPGYARWWAAACTAVRKERAGVPVKKRKKQTVEVVK